MSRKVFLILFILFSVNQFSFAQKIEPGRYVYEYGDDVKSIFEVLGDSTFYLTETFGTEHLFGCGNYSIEKNTLVLKFKDIPPQKLESLTIPEYKINKTGTSKKDYITIYLDVIESWGNEPLAGARINIYDFYRNIIRKNIKANDSGFAKIKVSNKFLPILVKVFFIGFDPLEFQINEIMDYYLRVILKSYYSVLYKENEIKKFQLHIIDHTSFRLDDYFGNFEWSTFYRE